MEYVFVNSDQIDFLLLKMDPASQRIEEAEVLSSIYGGDNSFQVVDANTFQYRVEPDQDPRHPKRFIIQINWPETYPESLPNVNLDIFYNSHLNASVKQRISAKVLEEAAVWLGSAMTYTLFEFAKENVDTLISDSDVAQQSHEEETTKKVTIDAPIYRTDYGTLDPDCKPRGWNWVDVVKHLSQTGGAAT